MIASTVAERYGINVHHGWLRDGAGRETVVAYLTEASHEVISRFPMTPEVWVIDTATPRERVIVTGAVDAMNLSHPADMQMRVGLLPAELDIHTDNAINIEFVDCPGWYKCGWAASTAVNISRDAEGQQTRRRSHIAFARGTLAHVDYCRGRILMAHELLHALGIDNHVSTRLGSIMQAVDHYTPATHSLLTPLDREALQALYTRLKPSDSPADLGPWAASSLHVAGNGRHANFGAALKKDYAEPWAHGYPPDRNFSGNSALSGWVVWRGDQLGLTPDAAAVSGNVSIRVDVETFAGNAVFYSLEQWPERQPSGLEGTGTQWLDGDLAYSVAVSGNTFRETGGDAGRLAGIFTGREHDGAAGTLEREDLTAAFRASQ